MAGQVLYNFAPNNYHPANRKKGETIVLGDPFGPPQGAMPPPMPPPTFGGFGGSFGPMPGSFGTVAPMPASFHPGMSHSFAGPGGPMYTNMGYGPAGSFGGGNMMSGYGGGGMGMGRGGMGMGRRRVGCC
eukprot:gnl/TRDRNA2_/TRDRNA2_203171_c0_seq1.p2 gnl/TRDRNA2_/TRDRNA2_203171_c0~~gnl/TRDRNA2_/TRDRNA2_203171_c0_seq1.p2  ORF type:complete len:130 (+),score=26.07 gnl/TRDRNA2_/TRDRNA2_203171_c0_seq1:128-517(+)